MRGNSRDFNFHLLGGKAGVVWINRIPLTKPKTTKQTTIGLKLTNFVVETFLAATGNRTDIRDYA